MRDTISICIRIFVLKAGILLLSLFALTAPARASSTPPLCFWSDQGPVCVERTGMTEAAAEEPTAWLQTLLAGPTPQEQARGLRSAIPEGTTLASVEVRPDRTTVVRLEVPFQALQNLDHATFEAIVEQIGGTLEPLGWRDLRIQTWDPITGEFVPLAAFLPAIEPPRKGTSPPPPTPSPSPSFDFASLRSGRGREGGGGPEGAGGGDEVTLTYIGQPPAPGQPQPQGALSGKTVYVSAGHGWIWNDNVDDWRTQRPPYPLPPYEGPIIEDHNNAEAVDQYLLWYLQNAGATVIPVRERDMNATERVVDNDGGDGYAEEGVWATDAPTGYLGLTYRYTTTVAISPTATAIWTATLPSDGEYAVYAWYRQGPDRAPDARYTIHHAGGQTEVVVDQRVHGDTWRYLGTYGFRGGEVATVTLSNLSAYTGTVVVADAVRFGGGTFSSLEGIQTVAAYPPDKPWWEVAAFYYVQRMGVDPDDYADFNDVIARPIYARWEHAGTGEDAIYVSWHTNGRTGYQWDDRGTVSIIHNGEWLPVTPGSEALRDAIHDELIHDIQTEWDPTWPGFKRSMNLGELRLLWDDDPTVRMPGTLIEIAYHDHPGDTDALKEPAFEMLVARAIYQGIVKYFAQRDGTDLPLLPEPPTHLAVRNVGGGQVRVSWHPSPTDTVGLRGDPATGYRVYTSTNGIGWSDGISVGNTTVYTLTGLSPGQLLFIRVTGTNDGGESFPTETLAVRVGQTDSPSHILLVSGFDRLNSTMLVADYDPVEGYNLRMLLDRMNTYGYTVQHGEVISIPFDSASNEAVRDGDVSLADYTVVDWILGEESAPDQTLDPTERDRLRAFLDGGGALFLSGTEIGWHLDDQGTDPAFYNDYLQADYVADDAGTYEVEPVAGSIFDGLPRFRFDAAGMYDADYPDVITPTNGSTVALTYSGGTGGVAAVQYADGCRRLVHFGFPFEVIHPDDRAAVMARVMDFLGLCFPPQVNTHIASPADGNAYNKPPSFEGTAEAGEATVLDRVEVQVRRESDGAYWTGNGWSVGESWVTATGTLSWTYPLTMTLTDGDYRLRARAWTTEGDADTSPAEIVFTYDTISPTVTSLITPTGGVALPALNGVTLEWSPVGPDGGSPLAYRMALDGQIYTTTQPVYTFTQLAHGPHVWGVQVFDAAGNRSAWVTDTFTISQFQCWLPVTMRNSGAQSSCVEAVLNGSFESDGDWTLNRLATYDTTVIHTGERSVRVGIPPGEAGEYAYSSVAQTVTLPTGGAATLTMWVYPISEGEDAGDRFYVGLFDSSSNYHSLDVWQSDARAWERREYDLSAYLGQTITLYIGVRNDGDDDTAAMYVDDVSLEVCP